MAFLCLAQHVGDNDGGTPSQMDRTILTSGGPATQSSRPFRFWVYLEETGKAQRGGIGLAARGQEGFAETWMMYGLRWCLWDVFPRG